MNVIVIVNTSGGVGKWFSEVEYGGEPPIANSCKQGKEDTHSRAGLRNLGIQQTNESLRNMGMHWKKSRSLVVMEILSSAMRLREKEARFYRLFQDKLVTTPSSSSVRVDGMSPLKDVRLRTGIREDIPQTPAVAGDFIMICNVLEISEGGDLERSRWSRVLLMSTQSTRFHSEGDDVRSALQL